MRQITIVITLLLCVSVNGWAQQAGKKPIRIVDTLTAQEKTNRDPVILKSELDSLINLYKAEPVQLPVQQQVSETSDPLSPYLLGGVVLLLLISGWMVFLFYRQKQRLQEMAVDLHKEKEHTSQENNHVMAAKTKTTKANGSVQSLEHQVSMLHASLDQLSKENEGLNKTISGYNGIQKDFDLLKKSITKAYKVKNYPGYDKAKPDITALQGVLETEHAVANYAYERFLKPVLAIADANKNNPPKISEEERAQLLELLVSLSLLYIEYLYLRVNDLSVGGKIVERLQGLTKGKGVDPGILKQLNTDAGSRALVVKMVLDKAALAHLSYPVFDETNLNTQ